MTSRLECGICFHGFDDFKRLPKLLKECSHTFCYTCLEQWLNRPTEVRDTCPMCRAKIDMSVEIPTNHKLLALYEKKKSNPKCSCKELREYYCPMCMSQNYAEWEERLEDGEHTFCIGCASNHADDTEHQVVSIDGNKPVTTISMLDDDCEVKLKQTGGQKRKVAVAVAVVVALLSAAGLTVALSQLI